MDAAASPVDSLKDLDETSDEFTSSGTEVEMKVAKPRNQAVPGPPPPKRPRRKAALKVTSRTSNGPIPSSPDLSPQQQESRGIRKKPSPRPLIDKSQRTQSIGAGDIYVAVSSGKNAMVTVVDEWLDSYKQNRKGSLLVLINFIVQSCGCKGVVSSEMFDNLQNAEIISTLTKEFNEDSVNYPLSNPGPQLKRFKAGLCEFAQLLVYSCRNSLIYDEYLFPSLLALLTGLSDSQVRAFRHTSTLLAMKLMTGLVKVSLGVWIQLQTAQKRYDIECSKRVPDRAPDRLEELKASVSELQENREEVSSMLSGMFRGVFVHRYRDQLSEIRAICIEELGVWLKLDPEHFLNDKCLKYLGWTLYDKRSPVRLKCVHALQGLYKEQEFIGRLELFTSRFKERMLSMVLDKDSDVAVEVVNLLLLIHQGTEEGLGEDECGCIYPLVYASHKGLASAAGNFLYYKLKSLLASDKCGNTSFIQILISFYIQSELHEHAAYLVDSLWAVAGSELRDWESMTSFLLQDCGEESEQGLVYEEEGALIDLMICTIKQAALGVPPVGRTHGKKTLSMKDKKIQEQDRRRITTHFIPLLPRLLAKYSADAEKVSLLLKAPLYFDLEMYSNSLRLKKHLDLLLFQICGIVEKHTELSVLQASAQLACTFCSDCYTFSTRAHLVFSQLLDSLMECFNTYLSGLLQGTAHGDDIYSAATVLKRIAALSSAKDLTGLQLFDPCVKVLNKRIEGKELETELIVSALKCAAFHLMWAKVNAVNSTPTEAELKHLKKDVRSYCKVCQICLSLDCAEIRDQAFELLCDLLLLYSPSSTHTTPTLQTLVYLPSDSLRCDMAGFLIDYIFSDADSSDLNVKGGEEMKITLLQKKRNQLSGYCKLVIYGVFDLVAATDVFKHYSKCFNDFGDIIKETISKSKQIHPVQSAKTVCLSLQQMFSEMLTEDPKSQDLGEIRELAKRLATSFGVDLYRAREPLVALHMDGIRFALRDQEEGEECLPNVAFLEILSEFSFKLLQADRAQLAAFLKAECRGAALSWPSSRMYQRSLGVQHPPVVGQSPGLTHDGPEAKRRRTAAPLETAGSASSSWLDSSCLDSGLRNPALTSTAQRQPGKTSRKQDGDAGGDLTEPHSEDEFSGLPVRKIKAVMKRRHSVSSKTSPIQGQQSLNSHFTLLSLFEDNNEIHSNSGTGSGFSPSPMRPTPSSILAELFD